MSDFICKPKSFTPEIESAISKMIMGAELLKAVAMGMRTEHLTPEVAADAWESAHAQFLEVIAK